MTTIYFATALVPITYLLGSIPFGLLIVRLLTDTDIRLMGSGNIGATNVRRAVGTKWAVVTLICDVLKGFLPLSAALWLSSPGYQWLPAIVTLAAIVGHMYPVYFGCKPGGKGVATTLGCLLLLAPLALILMLIIFIPVVKLSRKISLGSLAAVFGLPPSAWFTTHDPAVTLASLVIMVLVIARHEDNIKRLANGAEPGIGNR